MKTEFKTAIILGIVIAVAIASISIVFSELESTSQIENTNNIINTESGESYVIDKSNFKKAPDLVGISYYINTTPEQLKKEIEGKVVLYDIWTYSCINCVRTLPYISAWNEKYSDEGLIIVGIHSPEFEFEKNINNVEMAVEKHGIVYPVVMDNEMETWKAFENRYWPRKYLADNEGYIRYDHIGEGAYDETEKMIQNLLEERANQLGLNVASAETLVSLKEFTHTPFRTPELYFGYEFVQARNQLGNSEGFKPEQDIAYKLPENVQQNYFYLEGTWKNLPDSMKLMSKNGVIVLPFHAKEVNIVAANNASLKISLDGKPLPLELAGTSVDEESKVTISEPGLYNIIKDEEAHQHLLIMTVDTPGFKIYTFTFG